MVTKAPVEKGPPPEVEQVNHRITTATCPKCKGVRVYYHLRKKILRGKMGIANVEIDLTTSRSCLDCWHKW